MLRMLRAVPLCVAGLAMLSCGQSKMVQTSAQMHQLMLAGNYPGALAALRQSKNKGFKEQDRVAFWMNEGMLLHLTGGYQESFQVLDKCEKRTKELYTKKISKSVKAAFTSNAATDYEGEDYEKVLLNVFKAFNFLAMNKAESALVEARKINDKLRLYNTKYKHKNTYNQDAFAHWMMGVLFEIEGSYDDARIAYVKAMEVYQNDFAAHYGMRPPKYLAEDIVRASLLSGAEDIANEMKGKYGQELGATFEKAKTHGEVVVVHLNGEGPSKSDYVVTCWFLSATRWACDGQPGGKFMKRTRITIPSQGTVVKVAFPELHIHDPVNPMAEITAGSVHTRTEPALPISHIAVKAMADKMHRVYRDAIIRVITKTLTSKGAGAVGKKAGGKKAGGLLGWAAEKGSSAVMQAFEEADKRAWITLPARIDVAKMWLPPGTHTINIGVARGRKGSVPNVKVEAGKKVVITYRTLP